MIAVVDWHALGWFVIGWFSLGLVLLTLLGFWRGNGRG